MDVCHTCEESVEEFVVNDPEEDNTEDISSTTDSFFTEEKDDDDSSFDSNEWDPDSLLNHMNPHERSRE